MFKRLGKKTTIGTGVSFKQPIKIKVDKGCIIDDNVNLGVSGSDLSSIEINEKVFIGRGTEIKTREGKINISSFSSIGSILPEFQLLRVI